MIASYSVRAIGDRVALVRTGGDGAASTTARDAGCGGDGPCVAVPGVMLTQLVAAMRVGRECEGVG